MIELTNNKQKASLLIVEDEATNAIIISSAFYETFNTHHVSSGQEALEFCEKTLPDLILMDMNMPKMDGLTACRKLKSQQYTKDIPVVFITGNTDVESEDQCWEAGCTDFIAKPFSTRTLRHRVNAHISAKLMADKLKQLASMDDLTKLPNRRAFDGVLKKQTSLNNSANHQLSILLIDIDYFKQYNDTYGRLEGDGCMRCVAESLSNNMEHSAGYLTRYEGEEFAVLLPNTDLGEADLLAKQLQSSVQKLKIPHTNSPYGIVTVSIGGAVGEPPTMNQTDMLHRADANLYFAKSAGRNRVLVE